MEVKKSLTTLLFVLKTKKNLFAKKVNVKVFIISKQKIMLNDYSRGKFV